MMDKIILLIVGFETKVLMNAPLGKYAKSIGGILYGYSKEILDRDAHIHCNFMVFSIL